MPHTMHIYVTHTNNNSNYVDTQTYEHYQIEKLRAGGNGSSYISHILHPPSEHTVHLLCQISTIMALDVC